MGHTTVSFFSCRSEGETRSRPYVVPTHLEIVCSSYRLTEFYMSVFSLYNASTNCGVCIKLNLPAERAAGPSESICNRIFHVSPQNMYVFSCMNTLDVSTSSYYLVTFMDSLTIKKNCSIIVQLACLCMSLQLHQFLPHSLILLRPLT